MALSTRKTAIAAKVEATYGTDPVPTGSANMMLVSNAEVRPMNQTLVDRALIRSFFGNSEQLPGQLYAEATFECELQGSGTAGTAPKWGVLLTACGMKETIVAVTSVTYTPSSLAAEIKSVAIYYEIDGVRHSLTGARGDVSLILQNQQIPRLRFRFIGIYNTPSDNALSSISYTGWQKPVIANATNTATFSLHSISPVAASLEMNLRNNLVYRDYIGGTKQVLITDRKPDGSINFEANLMATKNWFSTVAAGTTAALNVVHGSGAGYITTIAAPNTQIVNPTYQDSDGIAMVQAGLIFVPGSGGSDELSIALT